LKLGMPWSVRCSPGSDRVNKTPTHTILYRI
jgi:hypothetical protein